MCAWIQKKEKEKKENKGGVHGHAAVLLAGALLDAAAHHLRDRHAGTVLLDDVEELLHIPVEDDVDTDTIGGYVFNALGHTPKVHDEVTIGAYCFTVLEMQRFRIVRLKAVPLPGAAAPGEDSGAEEDRPHES